MDYESLFVRTAWKLMDELHGASSSVDGLAAALQVICEACGCEQGSAWLLDQKDNMLYALAQVGDVNLTGVRLPMNSGVTGRVAAGLYTQIQSYQAVKAEFCPVEAEAGLPQGALMWIPLHVGDVSIGCIQFGRQDQRLFSREDQQICERCANIIALDLEDKGVDFLFDSGRKPLISIRNLSKDYVTGGKVTRVLKNVNLDIYDRELVIILGQSGSGKSTLLNIVGGMDRLTEANIMIDGKDFSHPTENEMIWHRRDRIGFIFQSYNLMPNLSAVENVAFTSEISRNPMDPMEAIALVGLSDRADHFPSALSGGQQQRVAIARAIAKSPRLILADEPTAALDFHTGLEVLEVLQSIVRKRGTTLIMVTHNAEIAKIANRVVCIKDGRISSVRINPKPLIASELSW